MSLPQDVFGASPKTVLNKPLFKAWSSTAQSYTGSVANVIVLDKLDTNEIAGLSLDQSTGVVSLPAGTYDINADIAFRSTAAAAVYTPVAAVLIDNDGNQICWGLRTSARNDRNANTAPLKERMVFSEPTDIRLALLVGSNGGLNESNLTEADRQQYATLRIEKLDTAIDTPVLSDPTMTLARPLMQVQDQKPNGTGAGTGIEGDNQRDLNVVLVNEIPGASLGINSINLPAGTYYIEAYSSASNATKARNYVSVDGVKTLVGLLGEATVNNARTPPVAGRVVLLATATITVITTISGSTGNVLGYPSQQDPHEVYTDLRIWQLDAVVRTPVLVNDKLFPLPGNVQVTGNMYGLEYEYTGANEVTIQAGACMDSTNEVPLSLAAPQALSIPAVADTVYNLFLCDDGFVRQDTDPDGAGLIGYKIRWLGLVVNNDSGFLYEFNQVGNMLEFADVLQVDQAAVAATYQRFDLGAFLNTSRIMSAVFRIGGQHNSVDHRAVVSTDEPGGTRGQIKAQTGYYVTSGAGTTYLEVELTRGRVWWKSYAGATMMVNIIRLKR